MSEDTLKFKSEIFIISSSIFCVETGTGLDRRVQEKDVQLSESITTRLMSSRESKSLFGQLTHTKKYLLSTAVLGRIFNFI